MSGAIKKNSHDFVLYGHHIRVWAITCKAVPITGVLQFHLDLKFQIEGF